MANSSNGKGNVVESGEQCSLWASNVERTLRILREELDYEVDFIFRILKLQDCRRQPTAAFSPLEYRFGLHNRDEGLDMSESEAAKRAVVVLYGLDEQPKWISFCAAVVPDPKAMLKCYGVHKELSGLLEDEIRQVLAFDALFLSVWIDVFRSIDLDGRRLTISRECSSMSRQMWDCFKSTFPRCCGLVRFDLCKIENQIPFDLIKRAIQHVEDLTNPRRVNGDHAIRIDAEAGQVPDSYLERWMKTAVREGMLCFMVISDGFYEGANANQMLSGSHHILDAAYRVVCGVDGLKRTSDYSKEDYIHVLSATRLKDSGIRIEGVAGPLSTMSYDKKKKCLYLPKMRIYDETPSLVRNVARYEQYHEGKKCMFHDYVFLMLDLIETPSDVSHLTKCGVIDNGCGNKGADMWRALNEGLVSKRSSKEHNDLKRDINNRCNLGVIHFGVSSKCFFYLDHG